MNGCLKRACGIIWFGNWSAVKPTVLERDETPPTAPLAKKD